MELSPITCGHCGALVRVEAEQRTTSCDACGAMLAVPESLSSAEEAPLAAVQAPPLSGTTASAQGAEPLPRAVAPARAPHPAMVGAEPERRSGGALLLIGAIGLGLLLLALLVLGALGAMWTYVVQAPSP